MYFGCGQTPSSLTVGSLLRTPWLANLARQMIILQISADLRQIFLSVIHAKPNV
jgi:hypothetical protein